MIDEAIAKFDPIELEVFSNVVSAIAEEACSTLGRTAYTTFLKESNDFAVALVNRNGEFLAYPRKQGVTTFIGLPIAEVILSTKDWEEGDILLTNDPYSSAGMVTHSPDFNLISPIFFEGELVAYCWGFLHSTDVGGANPGSLSISHREVYQEGIRIPPSKIYRAGELNEELLSIIQMNVRIPYQLWGDLKGIISAFHIATNRMKDVFAERGRDTSLAMIEHCISYAELKAQHSLRKIPNGAYEFHDYLDNDFYTDNPIRIKLTLRVTDGKVHLDFTGTDPQVMCAINIASAGKAHAWLTVGMVHYILTDDPSIPLNSGILRGVTVTAPEGTLVHAIPPASLGGRVVTGLRVMDATFGALSQAIPDHVPAAGAGQGMLPMVSTPAFSELGQRVNLLQPLVGGSGGRPTLDGYDGMDYTLGFLKNTPIEIIESELDVLIQSYFYAKDSAGEGKYRGGLGVGIVMEARAPDTVVAMRGMERNKFSPWGIFGGRCGNTTQSPIINEGRGDERTVRNLDVVRLSLGETITLVTSGGGGYGDPLERDPMAVLKDVQEEFVSPERALDRYGVCITQDRRRVDLEKTVAIRERYRNEPGHETSRDFHFGPSRIEHEQFWSDERYQEMHDILAQLPHRARGHAKTSIMSEVTRTIHDGGEDVSIAAVWEKVRPSLGM